MPCPDCHSSDMVEEIDSEAERLGLLAENCAVWRCLNCFTLSVRKRVEPRKKAAPPPKPEHRDRSWQPYTSAAHLPLIVTPSSFPLHPREIKKVTLTTQPPSPNISSSESVPSTDASRDNESFEHDTKTEVSDLTSGEVAQAIEDADDEGEPSSAEPPEPVFSEV